jgi:hypothetical protein
LVVTWTSLNQDGDGAGVFARRFGPDGSPLEDEFQVNVYTVNSQVARDAAADGAGDFVVTWSSYGQDGDAYGAYGRRYLESEDVPVLSPWGLVALSLLLLAAGIAAIIRRRAGYR